MVLALALLAAWQAALVHPIAHVDDAGTFVHLGDGDPKHGSASGELCDVLSALTACASISLAVLGFEQVSERRSVAPRFEPRRAQAPPFFSQGPPAVL